MDSMKRNLLISIASLLVLIFLSDCGGIPEMQETPLEQRNYSKVTSHQELLEYIKMLDDHSDLITISIIGASVQGREIPVVHYSSRTNSKIKVLVFCQQHGNEPSGKEAALLIIKELAGNSQRELYDNLDLYIIPSVNPDGNEAGKRRNANGEDLNRNHLILTEPETIALHKFINELNPQVTLDVHEYSAFRKSFREVGYVRATAEQFGAPTNLNISKSIRKYAHDSLFVFLHDALTSQGVSFSNYYKINGPTDTVRSSTTAINDGRQSLAILNNFSFILEGRNGESFNADLKRRASDQLSAIKSFLEFVNSHSIEIESLVTSEREKLVASTEDVIIQMDYRCDGGKIELPMQTLPSFRDTIVSMLFSPMVYPIKSVSRPAGYIIPKDESGIIELLNKHNIEYEVITQSTKKQVEIYRIRKVSNRGMENKTIKIISISKRNTNYTCSAGDIFVPINQVHSTMLCIALEPESMWGLVQFKQFEHLLTSGEDFPVYRVSNN